MNATTIIQAMVSFIVLGLWAYMMIKLPDADRGDLNMAATLVVGYWLGSALGSSKKDAIIADLSRGDNT